VFKAIKYIVYIIGVFAISYTAFCIYMLYFFEADIKCLEIDDIVSSHPTQKFQVVKNTSYCDDGRPIVTKLEVVNLTTKEDILIYKVESKKHPKLAVYWRDDLVIDIYIDEKLIREKEDKPDTKFKIEYKSH
jgi:hypothetical protein